MRLTKTWFQEMEDREAETEKNRKAKKESKEELKRQGREDRRDNVKTIECELILLKEKEGLKRQVGDIWTEREREIGEGKQGQEREKRSRIGKIGKKRETME